MDRYIAIFVGCPLGFVIMYFKRAIKEFIGEVGFAEKYLGMGGTNTFVVLVGILVFIGSLMYGLGTFQALLDSSLGMFFKK
ncbi:hypothetical protein HZA40_02620 [Candidatus Peregrinibacteria bacterium]|nr:hypothetical protein [Candidatus Peregrinibacteria bacterium]